MGRLCSKMVKYIYAFPGQGAQAPGMIKDVCERFPVGKELLDKYSKISGIDIPSLLWNSTAEDLARSDNSQTGITAASLAAVEILKSKGVEASAVAGFSLGEWSALCVSGVLSFEETVYAVKRRGEIMQAVCEEIAQNANGAAPGMAAVIGLEPAKIKEIISDKNDVFAVNMNSVKQTVVAGTAAGLDWAETAMKDAGAKRYVRLKVAGPFHSPLMQKAADEFSKVLEEVTFNNPKIALFSNVTGKQMFTGAEAKSNAIKHIVSPVLWTSEEDEISAMCKQDGNDWQLLETGPGSVLCGLWKNTEYSEIIPCTPWESFELLANN